MKGNPMTDPVNARLADLEARLVHHERALDELSVVVAAQGRAHDRLTTGVRSLTERLRDLAANLPRPPDDKPPPHY